MKFKLRVPKWRLGLLAIALLAGTGYLAFGQITQSNKQDTRRKNQTAIAERLSVPVTIAANGTVQPERSVNMSPKNSGVLRQLLVKEGDRVEAGQVLAYMDSSNLQGQQTQAQAQLASAQANLDKLIAGNRPQEVAQAQAEVSSAQANLRQATLTFNQNQQLYTSGALSLRELDTSRTAYNTATAQVEQAKQKLNLQQVGSRPEDIATARAQVEQAKQALSLQKSGSRDEDIAAARAQLMNAKGALQTIQAQINDTIIRAPFDGVITRKFADPGAFVTPTTSGSSVSSATSSSILSLASTNQIVAKVPETNISKIKVGMQVTIAADAYPNQSFSGKVTQVATQSTIEQNVTFFEVKLSLQDPKNQLQAGMNVSNQFKVGTLDNAIVIPTVAIVRQERGTGVLLAGKGENGRSKFQPITTGASVADKTVVVSGLKAGDTVLLSFPPGERPTSNTPSLVPGMGGSGGSRRGGG
ncbi:MAG: efflux RND transporter periplasmic adaptor subunit [Leptolyngbyaceae cyanobacterium CSU_1_3]|nr:efflux RND transporter periplasmic adaptor subunit [Leptolyngbyaceae cyanobacterium CSU_1_3]